MRSSAALAREELQAFLDTQFSCLPRPEVMDVGCGGAMRVKFPTGAVFNGIDISAESAARNSAISSIIIGDIQQCPLPRRAYDVVVCWELLEHVRDPLAALSNMIASVRQGGLIVLAFPNRASLKGVVTRYSPHWLHVWLMRRFWGQKNAGRPGYAPFETYLAPALAPEAIRDFTERGGFETVFFRLYEGNRVATLRRKAPVLHLLYQAALSVLNRVLLRKSDLGLSDVLLVVKPTR
jgi:SAM-dependent methyltransferase